MFRFNGKIATHLLKNFVLGKTKRATNKVYSVFGVFFSRYFINYLKNKKECILRQVASL